MQHRFGYEYRMLVARHGERRLLDETHRSTEAELVAVYGRRRVGKTFLIRQGFGASVCFELVGIHGVDRPTQLRGFAKALAKATGVDVEPPADWFAAFSTLEAFLAKRLKRRSSKQVVVFDEVPWLASRKSGFLPAFEHFWNSWASRQRQLVVVLCGSAASWMLEHVVTERGGLHNRVTRRLRVEPFGLRDAEELLRSKGVELGRYQTVELYLALGGVPHYLAQVRPGDSAAQNVDRLCFARDGFLRTEFQTLFTSLFERSERHEAVVRTLATKRRGMTRTALLDAAGLGSGGTATKVLEELEESGFIAQLPHLGRAKKDGAYWLTDEYSLFYLSWIEPRPRSFSSGGVWLRKQGTPAWRAWAGLAFEAVCLKHVRSLKAALGIEGLETTEASWAAPGAHGRDGAQIDLVIDRADRCTNLCELKFSESEFVIDKAYARELKHKRDAFREVTGTKKALFLTMVTSYGVRPNEHARELVARSLTMDALFTPLTLPE